MVCNEKPQDGDTEEKCISGTSLDTRSSPAGDRTQQSKTDVQYKQTVHTGLSGKEKTQSTLQASKLPLKICGEKRLLFNGSLDEQTFTERSGKKIKSDCNSVQNSVQIEAEIRNKKKSHSVVKIRMSFKQESMNGFLKDVTVDLQGYRNYTPMVDQPLDVHTSWEGCAAQSIEIIARKSKQEVNFDVNTPSSAMEPADFLHYAKIVTLLVQDWYEKQDRKDIFFKIGKFTVKLRSSNLYCCPFNQAEKERKFPDRQLSYATLTTSENFSKKYSQTVWNYVVGNHGKVYSQIETPQDAVALCAVLFSEVIRYPNMFFHNILMMQQFKTWDDFCNYHPMVKGGTWKYQGKSSNISQQENLHKGIKIPEKVKNREHENHLFCVKEIIKDKENRCSPFQLNLL
ncbi:uncharacterized protein si:dkey-211g8.8 [Triplophysa rosa]|uniref:uncharacterized protein si:dkey-211g8.8 n=1 Tax=Triplophysa rosa TaxID=992332 RepID=UPI002545E095|nr:uncharacterized protein si:dkey-211g8.8 [Triplophysa rosa]